MTNLYLHPMQTHKKNKTHNDLNSFYWNDNCVTMASPKWPPDCGLSVWDQLVQLGNASTRDEKTLKILNRNWINMSGWWRERWKECEQPIPHLEQILNTLESSNSLFLYSSVPVFHPFIKHSLIFMPHLNQLFLNFCAEHAFSFGRVLWTNNVFNMCQGEVSQIVLFLPCDFEVSFPTDTCSKITFSTCMTACVCDDVVEVPAGSNNWSLDFFWLGKPWINLDGIVSWFDQANHLETLAYFSSQW